MACQVPDSTAPHTTAILPSCQRAGLLASTEVQTLALLESIFSSLRGLKVPLLYRFLHRGIVMYIVCVIPPDFGLCTHS